MYSYASPGILAVKLDFELAVPITVWHSTGFFRSSKSRVVWHVAPESNLKVSSLPVAIVTYSCAVTTVWAPHPPAFAAAAAAMFAVFLCAQSFTRYSVESHKKHFLFWTSSFQLCCRVSEKKHFFIYHTRTSSFWLVTVVCTWTIQVTLWKP